MTHDVVIVGAGLSGLICARRLVDAGLDVRVVEASPRVGGRLRSGQLAGTTVDLGGQWMSVGQPRLTALAGELGITSVPHHRDGRPFLDERAGWWTRLASALAQWRAVRRIERASHATRTTNEAVALDHQPLEAWLAGEVRQPHARARIAMHAELIFAAEPAALSTLHYLTTLAATGGFSPRGPDLPGGARDHRFAGGAASIAHRLAEGLPIALDAPVHAIDQAAGPARVHTRTTSLSARRVVLALPPAQVRRIDVELAPSQRRLVEASRPGPVVKCFAAYERPFWRDAGWSGEGYRPRGTVRATVELADPAGGPAALLAFVVGPPAARWASRDPGERRAEILATLVAQFGAPAAAPIDYLEMDWAADPWSAGCVAGLGLGALAHGARWREPHGLLHIAGTESAARWPGYMEGALEAGERAAAEVLHAVAGAGASFGEAPSCGGE